MEVGGARCVVLLGDPGDTVAGITVGACGVIASLT
jgi:hypothetical protein